MSFPRYPKYKESGVAWLGEVPAHWSVLRLKNVLAQRVTDGPHTTPVFIDEGVPFLSVDGIQDGELVFDGCRFISEDDHSEFKRKVSPRRDDLLMGKAASTGKIARVKVDFDFSIWSPLALIRLNRSEALPEFVEFVLKSKATQAEIDNYCTANTQKNISMDDIPKLILTHPPIDEQAIIATFLDRETAKIDALVAEQENLIGLLKEKRQAVISNAVTKGLDSSVPMKDSGVEWLGAVPAHWGISNLKRLSPEITVGVVVEPSRYYCEDGIPALRSLNIAPMKIRQDGFVYFSDESNEQLSKSKLRTGDLVAVRSGQPGTTAIVPPELDGCNCIDLIIIRKPPSDYERFLCWYLNSDAAIRQFIEGSDGAIQQHFNVSTAMNLLIVRPPFEEQLNIVADIESRVSEIDELMSEAVAASQLLQERRTALISAAVTGQIDVRGLFFAQTEEGPA